MAKGAKISWFDLIAGFNKLIGNNYRYRVRFVYKDGFGRKVFDIENTVGVVRKRLIDEHREVKRILGGLHKNDEIKHLLCNGTLHVEPMCYLGWY